jgi:pimeloyl-ACP methyl ester carboxylesterase
VRHRTLFGWLLPVPGATRTVVVLHGWGSNAEQMLPIAAPLWRAGLNVLLCDARNHGNSDSDVLTALVARYVEWVIGYRFETIAPLNTVRQIACPVLLVHGKDDRTVPIDDARRILGNGGRPTVQLLEIEDAGHDSTDQIERYTGALLRFLDASWSAGQNPVRESRREAGPLPATPLRAHISSNSPPASACSTSAAGRWPSTRPATTGPWCSA